MPSLNDRVVLLTGGATGIGRAIALDMAAAGAAVAIGDTNVDGGQQTVNEILSAGGRASFRSCDVAELDIDAWDRDPDGAPRTPARVERPAVARSNGPFKIKDFQIPLSNGRVVPPHRLVSRHQVARPPPAHTVTSRARV